MAKFCNKCNSPIEEEGYFCTECGSNDIRDDKDESEEPKETPIVEQDNHSEESIPEIETSQAESFGEKSIEQLMKSTIKPIENAETNVKENEDQQNNELNNIEIEPEKNKQENNNFTPKKAIHKKKNSNTILKIIFAIVVIIAVGLIIFFIYSQGKKEEEKSYTKTSQEQKDIKDQIDYTKIFTPENSFRVGNEKTGYISIPNTWAQVIQPPGSNVQQYTDGNSWVVTLMSTDTSQYSAETYANSIYDSIKQGGGQNIETGKTKIAGYTALTIMASYPKLNKYLTTWCFESKLGKTHYLAIEGPESNGDNYNIIYSFKEDQ